jgi:hypothetical protein
MKVLLSAVVTLKHELIVDLVAAKAAKFGGWWRDRGDWLNVCAFHHSSVKETFLNCSLQAPQGDGFLGETYWNAGI